MTKILKVLIAEDGKVTQRLLEKSFEHNKLFEIKVVENGEEALTEYGKWHPDIVLMDILMPRMNGFQTLQCIREKLKDQATCVIMVSSVNARQDILACAELGIQGYILKPFKTGELSDTVLSYYLNAERQEN
ncbi:MAG: response regulator [Desulfurivibrionaceae bacterium]